jgi:hypothetical protein
MRNPNRVAQGVLDSLGSSFATVVNPSTDLQNVNEKMRENDKLGFWRQMRIVANKRLICVNKMSLPKIRRSMGGGWARGESAFLSWFKIRVVPWRTIVKKTGGGFHNGLSP